MAPPLLPSLSFLSNLVVVVESCVFNSAISGLAFCYPLDSLSLSSFLESSAP